MRCAVLAASLAIATTGFAQQAEPPVIRVQSNLVPVYVNATDTHGAPIAGLTKQDFTLTEDGMPQRIALFEKESEQPLSIVLAIDTSGSTRKDWRDETAAATRFLKALVRPVDKVELVSFATYVREIVPFTNDMKQLERGLGDLHGDFATAVYDAVQTGAQQLQNVRGRKIIVVISDGANTVRRGASYQDALRASIQAEAPVYSIIDVPVSADAGREVGGEHALITLSEDSGGKFYYGGDGAQMESAFKQLSDDLRTQYLLGYYPSRHGDGSDYRAIHVSVAEEPGKRISLRYRPGYYPRTP